MGISHEKDEIDVKSDQTAFVPVADKGELLGPDAEVFGRMRGFTRKVKGALVESVFTGFEREHADRVSALRKQFVPAYQQILDDGILGSSWYPEIFFCALLRAADRVAPPESLEKQVYHARSVFEGMSRRYHSLFYRMAGPKRLLTISSKIWRLYHTIGTIVILDREPNLVEGELRDNPAILEPGYAEGTIGAFWGAFRLAGARGVKVQFDRRAEDTLWLKFTWQR